MNTANGKAAPSTRAQGEGSQTSKVSRGGVNALTSWLIGTANNNSIKQAWDLSTQLSTILHTLNKFTDQNSLQHIVC